MAGFTLAAWVMDPQLAANARAWRGLRKKAFRSTDQRSAAAPPWLAGRRALARRAGGVLPMLWPRRVGPADAFRVAQAAAKFGVLGAKGRFSQAGWPSGRRP